MWWGDNQSFWYLTVAESDCFDLARLAWDKCVNAELGWALRNNEFGAEDIIAGVAQGNAKGTWHVLISAITGCL